jgi:hypothetical protein
MRRFFTKAVCLKRESLEMKHFGAAWRRDSSTTSGNRKEPDGLAYITYLGDFNFCEAGSMCYHYSQFSCVLSIPSDVT